MSVGKRVEEWKVMKYGYNEREGSKDSESHETL